MEPVPPADPVGLARAHRDTQGAGGGTRALGASSDVGPALTRIAAAAREVAGADLAYVTGTIRASASRACSRAPGSEGDRPDAARDPASAAPAQAGEVSLPVVVEEEVVGPARGRLAARAPGRRGGPATPWVGSRAWRRSPSGTGA